MNQAYKDAESMYILPIKVIISRHRIKNGCTDLYHLKLLNTKHKSNFFPRLKCLLRKYSRYLLTRYTLEEHKAQEQRFVAVSDICIPPEVLPLEHCE